MAGSKFRAILSALGPQKRRPAPEGGLQDITFSRVHHTDPAGSFYFRLWREGGTCLFSARFTEDGRTEDAEARPVEGDPLARLETLLSESGGVDFLRDRRNCRRSMFLMDTPVWTVEAIYGDGSRLWSENEPACASEAVRAFFDDLYKTLSR